MINRAYPRLIKLLIEQGKTQEALEYFSRGRSRALEARIQFGVPGRSRLNSFRDINIKTIGQLAVRSNVTIVMYGVLKSLPPPPAEQKELIESVIAWVVRPDGSIHFHSLPFQMLKSISPVNLGGDLVKSAVGSFQATIPRGVVDRMLPAMPKGTASNSAQAVSQGQTLRVLHDVLIGPLMRHLPADPKEEVIIIPDGDLFAVPFNALLDGTDVYLIERHTLALAPSIGVLMLLTENRIGQPRFLWKRRNPALVVGDPRMPSLPPESDLEGSLPQLPGANREAQMVARLLGVQPLIGQFATEEALFRLNVVRP